MCCSVNKTVNVTRQACWVCGWRMRTRSRGSSSVTSPGPGPPEDPTCSTTDQSQQDLWDSLITFVSLPESQQIPWNVLPFATRLESTEPSHDLSHDRSGDWSPDQSGATSHNQSHDWLYTMSHDLPDSCCILPSPWLITVLIPVSSPLSLLPDLLTNYLIFLDSSLMSSLC